MVDKKMMEVEDREAKLTEIDFVNCVGLVGVKMTTMYTHTIQMAACQNHKTNQRNAQTTRSHLQDTISDA
ncbi:hypothetical protein QVD17_02203 [Tagetes erecta]|uniref:Uncharacterized protein n=1 Tax=Tagetes erecta TaxID=13708 RepID=A0AAD8L8R6_TARER|nr:hypothetical protein QVD17_02203 [Tagetes erecta]